MQRVTVSLDHGSYHIHPNLNIQTDKQCKPRSQWQVSETYLIDWLKPGELITWIFLCLI